MLLSDKRKLPPGIYVNEEFLLEIKKTHDRLRPILKLAKSIPELKDKSRMEKDKPVNNGVRYGLDDLGKLPPELAPYKATKKTNDQIIAFQGELSPCSNFHRSPFHLDDACFTSAEQWIQFQKSRLFNDYQTAEEIMQTDNPNEIEAKVQNLRI